MLVALVCGWIAFEFRFCPVVLAHHLAQYVFWFLPWRKAKDCADSAAGQAKLALLVPLWASLYNHFVPSAPLRAGLFFVVLNVMPRTEYRRP